MAMYISPRYINILLDVLFRGVAPDGFSGGFPSTFYLALLVRAPVLDEYQRAYQYATGDEVTYTGYARRTLNRTLTGFLSTQGDTSASTGTSATTRPAAGDYFPICTTSSQIVTHAALVTHSNRPSTGNNAFCYWDLPQPFQLSNTSPGFYPYLHNLGFTIQMDD